MVVAEVRSANRSLGRRVGEQGPNPVPATKLLFDPVLHLAPGAVDPLVQGPAVAHRRRQRGHDGRRSGATTEVAPGSQPTGWGPWQGARPCRSRVAHGSSCPTWRI